MPELANTYLENLNNALKQLPSLLNNTNAWDSLIINRRQPHTYRVFTELPNGMRCCLHKFEQCDDHEAFPHPHPWPGAFIILDGQYKMEVGYSKDRVSKPDHAMTLILPTYSIYTITDPYTWHSVIPLETTYTIMINGSPWGNDIAHSEVRTTKGKDLEKMPAEMLERHLNRFKQLLSAYDYFEYQRKL